MSYLLFLLIVDIM